MSFFGGLSESAQPCVWVGIDRLQSVAVFASLGRHLDRSTMPSSAAAAQRHRDKKHLQKLLRGSDGPALRRVPGFFQSRTTIHGRGHSPCLGTLKRLPPGRFESGSFLGAKFLSRKCLPRQNLFLGASAAGGKFQIQWRQRPASDHFIVVSRR